MQMGLTTRIELIFFAMAALISNRFLWYLVMSVGYVRFVAVYCDAMKIEDRKPFLTVYPVTFAILWFWKMDFRDFVADQALFDKVWEYHYKSY